MQHLTICFCNFLTPFPSSTISLSLWSPTGNCKSATSNSNPTLHTQQDLSSLTHQVASFFSSSFFPWHKVKPLLFLPPHFLFLHTIFYTFLSSNNLLLTLNPPHHFPLLILETLTNFIITPQFTFLIWVF